MINHSRNFLFRVVVVLVVSFVLNAGGPARLSMQGNHPVVILVVDDFTGEAIDVSGLDASDSCAVSFEEQAFAVRGAAAGSTGDMAHGDLVYAQLEEMLVDAGADSTITLVTVDIHGLTSDAVAIEIQSAMDANPADMYVANMSFALIPCDMVTAFTELQMNMLEAREAKNLNRYRGLLQRAVVFYDGTVFPAKSQRAQDMENLNPLQDLFAAQGAQLVPVAAAGNYGLDFPFWPGAWSQVVSVSASVGEGFNPGGPWNKADDTPLLGAKAGQRGQNSRVSNYGEVMLPGEYISEVGLVSGTSFAAPRLTVALALYVAEVGQDYCQNEEGLPALAYGDWDNLTLDEVAQDYCEAIVSYVPVGE